MTGERCLSMIMKGEHYWIHVVNEKWNKESYVLVTDR